MKKLVLFVLLLPALVWAQSGAFGHGGMSVSQLLPIINDAIADSSRWTAGSHVHAIKPKDGKSIEADSAKFGALHVTGNTTLDGTLTMVTTATEQVKLGTGSDAAPELSSAGDTDTGIRFPGGNKMQLVQGGLNSHTFRPYQYTQTASDGDTLSINADPSFTYFRSTNTYYFYKESSYFGWDGNGLYSVSDTKSLGLASAKWQNYWGSDNIYLGGKGQTARLLISGENTIAGTDSSWDINATGGVPTATAYHTGTFSNGGRRHYFGPDTTLINYAKTGRDSTVAFLPHGQMQLMANGMSAANYMKGIRLSNPDAATEGVQAFSPALVFRGSGWKTDATAGSDSVLVAMYLQPVQDSSAPIGRLMIDYKIGTGSWTNYAMFQLGGTMTITGNYATSRSNPSFTGSSGSASFSSEDDLYICMDNNNDDADTKSVIFYKNGALGGANASEVGRLKETGYFGLGTGTYAYSMIDVNNANVWSKPLFRLGRDKKLNIPADIDSSVVSVTGSGKVAFSTSLADTAANFNVQTNISRWDSSYVHREASNVVDTGEITLASGAEGFGEVKIGAEYAHFSFESDGTVTLITNTPNVGTTNDVDGKLNIYDGGTSVIIENQLGSTLKCLVNVTYMIP